MRNKVIEKAVAEIGYKEGANNENKYSQELYNIKGQEWCADFVRWCLIKAGAGDLYPISSYVPTIADWFDKKGQYKNSKANGGNYTPQKGDIILFDYNHNSTSDHIGLVDYVEGNTVYTIEGNKDNMVKRCEYSLDSADIRAYCIPDYPVENRKSIEEIAREVIDEKWDVFPRRKELLEAAGYNYREVQDKVNEILGVNRIYKTVTAKTGLNIRENATTGSRRIAGVAYNEKVQVLEENVAKNNGHNWDKVKYDTVIGYVANTYLK